jgi:hypothetical protein
MGFRASVAQLVVGGLAAAAVGGPAILRHADADRSPPRVVARADADTSARVSGGAGSVTVTVATSRDTGRRAGPITGSDLVDAYARAGGGADARKTARVGGKHGARVVVRHVIVLLLPDPLDSHLDWAFDSEVESVRRAFETADYLLDRFSLPWRPNGDGAQAAAASRDTVRRLAPGVMLFRRMGEVDTLAVVYLVGEVPTSGIHAAAFAAALLDRRKVLGADTAAGAAWPRYQDTLRIVGPTFSGSSPSLRNALRAAQARGVIGPVSIVSGGATTPSNATLLNTAAAPPAPNPDTDCPLPLRDTTPRRERLPAREAGTADRRGIVFHATVNAVDRLQCHIELAITNGLGIEPREIAYLRESGTQYGRSFSDGPSDSTRGRAAQSPSAPAFTHDSASTLDPAFQLDSALQIPFPMNISRLRKEYARNLLPGDTWGRGETSVTRIDWRDPASATESPTPLSELTAPMIERTLADIEQTLVLHHIRAVGILATDVRDRLFLASIVKERLRDVKVFFISSHSLYLRPELNRDLRGTLVVSTYPLFLENQFWDLRHQRRDRLVFTSDLAEGTYNATLAQLGLTDEMTDYGFPLQRFGALVPPVWITTVGASSLLPVTADSGNHTRTSAAYVLTRRPILPRGQAERSGEHLQAQGVLLAATLGAALVIAIYWSFTERRARAPAVGTPLPGGAAEPHECDSWLVPARAGLHWHRKSWVVFRFVAILCAFAPVTLVLLRPQAHGTLLSRIAIGVIVGTLLAACALVAWHYWRVSRAASAGRTSSGTGARGAKAGVVVAIVTVADPPGAAETDRPAPNASPTGGRWPRASKTREWAVDQIKRHWHRHWLQHAAVHGIAVAYLLTTLVFLVEVYSLATPIANMFFLRALALSSGVTPVIPLVIGALLLIAWCSWHLGRVEMLGDLPAFEAACRQQEIDASCVMIESDLGRAAEFERAVKGARDGLLTLLPGRFAIGAMVGLVFFAVWVLVEFDRSIETILLGTIDVGGLALPGSFDLLFRFLVLGAVTLSSWTLYRLLIVWGALRACLRNVEAMPLSTAFDRLPRSIATLTRFTPFNAPSSVTVDLTIDRAAETRWRKLRAMSERQVPSYAVACMRTIEALPPESFLVRASPGHWSRCIAR